MNNNDEVKVDVANGKKPDDNGVAWSSQEYVQSRSKNADKYKTYAVIRGFRNKALKASGIICLVLIIAGLVGGLYYAVFMVNERETDEEVYPQKTSTLAPERTSPLSPLLSELVEISFQDGVNETLVHERNNSVFTTDPVCRDLVKTSDFVFDCFHEKTFLDMPKNNTVKCEYINRVGRCIQFMIESEYGVDCNRLDRMYLLELRADSLKDRTKFDVIKQCPEWWDFYFEAVGVKN